MDGALSDAYIGSALRPPQWDLVTARAKRFGRNATYLQSEGPGVGRGELSRFSVPLAPQLKECYYVRWRPAMGGWTKAG